MNIDQAAHLATEISQCWRNGLATNTWETDLTKYSDVSRAWKAVEHLKRTERFAPVIATFHAAYQATPSSTGDTRTVCTDCNNDGWVTAPDNTHTDRPPTSAAQPCPHCRHGKRATESNIWKNRPQNRNTP